MSCNTDECAIRELLERYEHDVNTGDVDDWVSLWEDNAVRMVPNAPAVSGLLEIRESAAPMFAPNVTQMKVEILEIVPLGDLAFTRGTYSYSATPGGTDESISGSGKYLSILARQPDGGWKFRRDCFNEDA